MFLSYQKISQLIEQYFRMAVANSTYLSSHLGIKNLVHKQKLRLKALDVVLFGFSG